MKFSWLAYCITIAVVCFEGILAIQEKTFSQKQERKPLVRLSFLRHWGVSVGDLMILPVFNGYVIPYLNFPIWCYAIFFLVSVGITLFCHRAWWPTHEGSLGFIYPDWQGSGRERRFWYKDVSRAGWVHVAFMMVQLVFIFGYVFASVPREIVWYVCVIFLIFIPFGVIEPGVVEGWPLSKEKKFLTAGVAISLWTIVGIATWLKL